MKSWFAVAAALLVTAPFLAVAGIAGYQAAALPDSAGRLELARLLRATLFGLGFSIALISSVAALVVKAPDRKRLATAGVLLGCCHMALGFAVRSALHQAALNSSYSVAPLILPLALWAGSIWLALSSAKPAGKEKQDSEDRPSVEQPRLLSPP